MIENKDNILNNLVNMFVFRSLGSFFIGLISVQFQLSVCRFVYRNIFLCS